MRRLLVTLALLLAASAVVAQERLAARLWTAADCTVLTQGQTGDLCDDGATLYICRPSAGRCDTAGEWDDVGSSGGGSGDVTAVGECLTGACFSGQTMVTSATTAGGDASGPFSALVVANDSHTHGTSTIAGLDASDTTTGAFADARVDGSLEADEVGIGGDGSGTAAALVVTDDSHAHTGASVSGLDAAADISTGVLAHERGGLEADVSAFAGLVRIFGGSTSAVTGLAGLNTALGASIADGPHTVDTDDQIASEVPSTPVGTLAATNVQAALQELDAEDADTDTDDQIATEVPYTPAVGASWVNPDPTEAGDALDDLAARLTTEEAKADDDVPEVGDFGALALTGDVTSSGLATTIAANSVALTTDTTGNYAAGDAEAGAALTGDTATAFFSAGTIEDARIDGSAEADELVLAGDVDGTANANDLDETAVETELEAVLDLSDQQGQVGDAQIADAAVDGGTGGEIADASVTAADLATDSVSADELNATGVEAELEAVLDLADQQGAVTDAQVPDTLTLALESSTLTALLDDEVLVGTGAAAGAFTAIQNCNDTTGKLDWTGTAFACVTDQNSGGTTAIDALADAGAGDDAVALAEQGQVWTWDSGLTAATLDALALAYLHDPTADILTQRVLVVRAPDSGNDAVGTVEALLALENLDTNDPVTAGLSITSAAGGITTAIDAADADIVTVLATDGGALTAADLNLLDDGTVTLGAETTGSYAAGSAEAGDATQIAADAVVEADLKAVDSPADEEILTYESTTGDFEWEPNEHLFAANMSSLSASAVRYVALMGVVVANATESIVTLNLPRAVTPTYLYCEVATAPNNGAGTQTWTWTLRSSATDTDWSCVISEAETSCSDSSGSALSANVAAALAVTPAATPSAPGTARCSLVYVM